MHSVPTRVCVGIIKMFALSLLYFRFLPLPLVLRLLHLPFLFLWNGLGEGYICDLCVISFTFLIAG